MGEIARAMCVRVCEVARLRGCEGDLSDVAAGALQLLREALVHGVEVARALHCSHNDAADKSFALLVLGGNLTQRSERVCSCSCKAVRRTSSMARAVTAAD